MYIPKFIHTADWHLSSSLLYGFNEMDGLPLRLSDARDRIGVLVDFAIEKQVDFVLHCGDICDSANPNEGVRRIFTTGISRLLKKKIRFITISGNHDLQKGRVHWLKSSEIIGSKYLMVIEEPEDFFFRVNNDSTSVKIYAVPYGNYDMIKQIKEYNKLSKQEKASLMILATHIGVREGTVGVNEIQLRTECSVKLFDKGNYDCVVLGHYHKRQIFRRNICYSGSLIIQDFSERLEGKGFVYYDGCINFMELKDRSFCLLENDCFKKIMVNRRFKRFQLKKQYVKWIKNGIVKVRLVVSPEIFKSVDVARLTKQLKDYGAVRVIYDWKVERKIKKGGKEKGEGLLTYEKAIDIYCEERGIEGVKFIGRGKEMLKKVLSERHT